MRKMLVIALREYRAAVQTRAFLVSIVLLPVLMLGSFAVQALLRDKVDIRPKTFAVLDHTSDGKVGLALEAAARRRNETQLRDASGQQVRPEFILERITPPGDAAALAELRLGLSERVRQGQLAGIVEIGRDVYQPAPEIDPRELDVEEGGKEPEERLAIRFQTHSHTMRDFPAWVQQEVGLVVQAQRAGKKELSVEEVRAMLRPVPLLSRNLSVRDPQTGEIRDGGKANRLVSFLLPVGLVMMMFMMIFVGSTPLMQGVVEEKMQRIAEVLLGSVRPFPLMMGKLLGTVGVALTLSAIYLGGAYIAARQAGIVDHLPPRLIAWFLVYQVLGVLLYGSVFIAVGAACTSTQETQALLMPVTLLIVSPMFILTKVVTEPESALATGASFVPTATPMLMVARLSTSPGLPVWQPALGALLVLLAAVVCVWAAGRIFRVGLLMQGKGASFRDLARWIVQG